MFNLDPLTLLDRLEQADDIDNASAVFSDTLGESGLCDGFYMPRVPVECPRALAEPDLDMLTFGARVGGSYFPSLTERIRALPFDPITAYLKKNARPWLKNAETDCDKSALLYLADITLDHGISAGALFPIHGPGGSYAIYGIYTAREAPEAYRTLRDHMAALNLAVLYFHGACHARFAAPAPCRTVELAPRERECLHWVAAGESSKQIAYRLDLSTHTVNEVIGNAMRRLKAASRAEAVAKAILAGLIAP